MSQYVVEQGSCIAFGGTNARIADCYDGGISGFNSAPTPTNPNEFNAWMGRQILDAAERGSEWVVAGFPGPVSEDGKLIGPMNNVVGMAETQYNLREKLDEADPAVGRAIDGGLRLFTANDGDLASHAVASRLGGNKFGKVAAVIVGSGVGAGVVQKDPRYANVYHADGKNPYEIGHLTQSGDPSDTFENNISGPALEKRYGKDPRDLGMGHPAWQRVGTDVGRMITTLGLLGGVELAAPTGGVGAGASDKYRDTLSRFINIYEKYGNGPQRLFLPEVVFVDPAESQEFEMYGAEGLVRSARTRDPVAA